MYKAKQRPARRVPNISRKTSGRATKRSASGIDINKLINQPITVEAQKVYQPIHSFEDFPLKSELLHRIGARGYKLPTEIQDKTIHHSLAGKDIVGIAGTGTGKTGAFLIPLIQRLLSDPSWFDSLIITPTRELALQIEDEFKKLTHGTNLSSATLIGGVSMNKSLTALSRPHHVVIGTPGRMMDMAQRGKLAFKKFSVLVLDEFDRMLDMGFVKDVERITNQMSGRKQTLLFSATMPASQRNIIQKIVHQPMEVRATTALRSSGSVAQEVIKVGETENKFDSLLSVITTEDAEDSRVILFCETKRKASKISKQLTKSGILSGEIHGNKSQQARERALKQFRNGQIQVLVATDVMARGIDVTDVTMVINYEVPRTYDDYIHRIGRTGRAGKTGKAVTFID